MGIVGWVVSVVLLRFVVWLLYGEFWMGFYRFLWGGCFGLLGGGEVFWWYLWF